ncbi:MAG: D-glycero-beta-D-manno-heptose-7-phosphate kinase [Elusimicrobiota bacterium]
MIGKKPLIKTIDRLSKKRVMVIGDLMVDKYIRGNVNRISPEAPVPVVKINNEKIMPGGAGNVVNNLSGFNTEIFVGGVVGDDHYGRLLIDMLEKEGSDCRGVLRDNKKFTSIKTRIIAEQQQVVRADKEKIENISDRESDKILKKLKKSGSSPQGIIISDYGKGVVTSDLIKGLMDYARKEDIPVVVDPQVGNFFEYKNVTAITPNQKEAGEALGTVLKSDVDVKRAGRNLIEKLDCDIVLITRGSKGMELFKKSGEHEVIPTVAREVYDVSGAGDTVTSVFTLALASGLEPVKSAQLANYAAAVVVGKLGTATVSPGELKRELETD